MPDQTSRIVSSRLLDACVGRTNAPMAVAARTRIAITSPRPTDHRFAGVAADSDEAKRVGMKLVDESGFDPFDAGSLADSWRQQPGQPAYCTELTFEEMGPALAAADRTEAPKRRDLVLERTAAAGEPFSWGYALELNRTLFR